MIKSGYDELWLYFSISRASWLTLPRVLMHEMPDDWQGKMAELLNEWDETWIYQPDISIHVQAKKNNKFCKIPEYLSNYRHPCKDDLSKLRGA